MPEWSRKSVALLLCAGAGIAAASAAEKESLWEYAAPAADVIVYVNTRQPEQAMVKKLWRRISRGRAQALKEDAEERLFDVSGRDMELIANLHIVSMKPFSGFIEGVADITGNLQGDIGKLMETLKQNNGAPPQIRKQDELSSYSFTLPAAGALPVMDVMLVPIKANRIQFRVSIAGKNKLGQPLQIPAKRGAASAARFRGRELAFACAANPARLSGAPLAETENGRQLDEFLRQLEQFAFTGYVRGRLLIVDAIFTFRERERAGRFVETVRPLLNNVSSASGGLTVVPRALQSGREINILLPINISKAWNLISRLDAPGLRAGLSGQAAGGQ